MSYEKIFRETITSKEGIVENKTVINIYPNC
jgi:hypothetical protein